ncbi:MAG TPA: hypothetical protein VD865_01685 [Stenotrophomonas sp.]|nr:hypothetical protein [Stenotrophomonas sp.]
MKLTFIVGLWAIALVGVATQLLWRLVPLPLVSAIYTALKDRLTYVPGLGSQAANTIREAEWLFSAQSTCDQVLDALRSDMRRFLCLFVLALLSIPVIDVVCGLVGRMGTM